MARKRSYRRANRRRGRTEPESPQLLLSTIPFLGLIALLGVLSIAIMVAAFPATQPHPAPKRVQVTQHEPGVAPRGWLQEAQKQFHH